MSVQLGFKPKWAKWECEKVCRSVQCMREDKRSLFPSNLNIRYYKAQHSISHSGTFRMGIITQSPAIVSRCDRTFILPIIYFPIGIDVVSQNPGHFRTFPQAAVANRTLANDASEMRLGNRLLASRRANENMIKLHVNAERNENEKEKKKERERERERGGKPRGR